MMSPRAANYFWDVEPRSLDERKHKRLIISRLLNYGQMADWRWLARTYGSGGVKEVIRSEKRLGIREPVRRLATLFFH